jgi:hypothetical protein
MSLTVPETSTTAIAPNANQTGISIWPSENVAGRLYDAANIGLIIGLVLGVVCTFLVVWMGQRQRDIPETRAR